MEQQPLPISADEITTSWIAEKLNRPLKSAELTRTDHGTASKLFFTIIPQDDEEEGKPLHICVKGGFNPLVRQGWPDVVHLYINEANFFNHIAPKLEYMDPPPCLWAGSDSQQGIVILEDLSSFSGGNCTFGTPLDDRSLEEVLSGVEQLAGLHAATWVNNRKKDLSKADDKNSDYPWLEGKPDYLGLIIPSTAPGVWEETYASDGDRPMPARFRESQACVEGVMRKYERIRNKEGKFGALVHGDAHVGNTYFIPTTGEGGGQEKMLLRFLDWQLYFVGSVFHDVSYFIASSFSVEDRRKYERTVLDHYLVTLAEKGKESGVPVMKSTDEDVWREYTMSFLSGVGWIVTLYSMQSPERVHAISRKFTAAIEDHGVIEMVEGLPDL